MRTPRHVFMAATLITVGVVATAPPAHAGTGRGPGGQALSVTPSTGIDRSGATVTVSGRGYDVTKGIYVAFCVDNGPGAAPSPCGGGADMTGALGASHWISSNPPSYGEGLAVPYGPGGSFRITLRVTPAIGDVDCTTRRCAVVTRADHTRTADRSQDVRVPTVFARPAPAPASPRPATSGATAPGRAPSAATGAPGGAAAPATTTARPASPAGAPVTTAAGDGAAPTAAAPSELAISRVSTATEAGRGWTVGLVVLALSATALLGLRRWRRRGQAR